MALGSLLVVVWDYRVIFAVVGVVTVLAALHIAFWLRAHIAAEWRRGTADVDPGSGLVEVAPVRPTSLEP